MAPAPWPHGNSVLLLRPLSTVLARLGVDAERFLAEVGVDAHAPASLYVPNTRVDAALEGIAASRGDETFGLTLAREAVARPPVGLFGHLIWLSDTVHGAFAQAARFYSLVTRRATLTLDVGAPGPGSASFTQRMLEGARRGRILTEYMFATLVLRARAAAGEAFRVRSMRFGHAARSAAPYEDLFQAEVAFAGEPDRADQAVDALVLDASLLSLPLSSADPFTAAALEAQLAQLRGQGEATAPDAGRAGSVPLIERVRSAVQAEMNAAGARPSLARVARRLGVGGRALRRQLEDQHISLRALVAAAQTAHARERLAVGATVKEVAFELGFSEPSAFSRAYKRWTGKPPSSRGA